MINFLTAQKRIENCIEVSIKVLSYNLAFCDSFLTKTGAQIRGGKSSARQERIYIRDCLCADEANKEVEFLTLCQN